MAPAPAEGKSVYDFSIYTGKYFLTGALAGGVCCSVTHGGACPIDVVKTRMQLDPELGSKGMMGAGRAIARTLVCRYVRREVRRLSDKDRELYLDAVQQLAALGAAEGRAKYGARFFNLDHFASLHLALSATRGPDQLHDGVGFLTGMIALSGGFYYGYANVRAKEVKKAKAESLPTDTSFPGKVCSAFDVEL